MGVKKWNVLMPSRAARRQPGRDPPTAHPAPLGDVPSLPRERLQGTFRLRAPLFVYAHPRVIDN